MENRKIVLPENVKKIIETLQTHGYEAYAVGGCVRDSVLGRIPQDWDITTSAMPQETKTLFDKTFDTGIEHGTITVLLDHEGYEVTTYRIDGKYEDNRHPKEVTFTRSLKEDLLRRDFTINAMAYNDADGLVDIFGGMEDLKKGVIRCVGDATARFSEDAMKELAPTLRKISAERIQVELVKTLVSDRPDMLRTAYELGITKQFLPEFDLLMKTEQETPHHMYNVGEHTLHALMRVRPDRILRITMLLHDMGKPEYKTMDETGQAHFKKHAIGSEHIAKEILKRLKFDNETIRTVARLVLYHDYRMPAEAKNVRRAMNKIGEDIFEYYMEVRRADVLAQSTYLRERKLKNLDDIEILYAKIKEAKQCVSLKELAVSGSDLIAIGIKPGKEIGEILNRLLEMVIEDPELNQKEILLKKATI